MIFSVLLLYFISLFQINNGIPYIQNYTKDDFSTRSINHSVTISNTGHIYFGNEEGILIFDGLNWSLHRIENTQIFSVFIDSTRTYIGGLNEFGFFRESTFGELKYHSLKKDLLKKKNAYPNYTRSIQQFGNSIFFGSDNKITKYTNDNYNIFKTDGKFSKLFKVHRNLYVHDTSKGILKITENNFHLINHSTFFKSMKVTDICESQKGLLVATKHNGIYRMSESGISELNKVLKNFQITTLSNFSSNKLLVGTTKNGLLVTNMEGNITEAINKEKGLIENKINDLKIDHYGNAWVATNLGLSYIHFSVPLRYHNYYKGLKNIIGVQRVKNKLYLATLNGISQIDLNKKQLSKITQPEQIITERPYSLHIINNDVLSLSSNGIRKNNEKKMLSIKADRFFSVSTINPNLIYTNHNGRLKRYIYQQNKFIFQDSISVDVGNITTLIEIHDNVWIGTKEKGVFKLKFSNNVFTGFDHYNHVNDRLIDQTFLSNIRDTLYISTKKELHYFDFTQQKIVKSEDQKLHVNFGTDYHNRIWYFKWQTKHVRMLNQPKLNLLLNSLPSSILYTVYHDSIGDTWLGFEDGLVQYSSEFKKDINQTFPIHITKISLNQDSILFGGFHPKENRDSLTFSIDYSQNQLRFEYAAAFYEKPEKTQYSFKLVGYDNDWSTYSSETFKDYTGLFEGTYTFKVKAKNIYETEGKTASYTFTILPPWYRSIFAYILYIIIFFYLSYLFNSLITSRKLKRLNELRRVEIAEGKARESELRILIEKERMRTRISEDLHDEIGSNLSYIQLMSEVLEKRNNTSGDQKEFKYVSESASEMSQAMRDIVWFVNPENDTYEMFINKLSEVSEKFLDPFDLSFKTEIDCYNRQIDLNVKRNIYLILKEVLQNIIKHAEASTVKIIISHINGLFKLYIKDDGKGFDTSLNQHGNGLINYQKRSKKINGTLTVSSKLGKGTEITLEVPL